nr:MAG TPA: hypothetical protein [Caudoviricetes sp.]
MRFISKITISVHQFQEGPSNTTGLYRIPRSLNSVLLHFVFLLVFFRPGLYTEREGSFPLPLSAGVSPLVACPAWAYCWA